MTFTGSSRWFNKDMLTGAYDNRSTVGSGATIGYARNKTSSNFHIYSYATLNDLTPLTTDIPTDSTFYDMFLRPKRFNNGGNSDNLTYYAQGMHETYLYGLLHPNQTNSALADDDWIDPAEIDSNKDAYTILAKVNTQTMANLTNESYVTDYEEIRNNIHTTTALKEIMEEVIAGTRDPNLRIYWVTEDFYNNYFEAGFARGVVCAACDGTNGYMGVYVKNKVVTNTTATPQTMFDYRVCDADNNILGSLQTIASDPVYTIEKNSSGIAIDLDIAELPGNDLVALGNIVKILKRADSDQSEQVHFEGKISRIKHFYEGSKQFSTITLLSLGQELGDYLASKIDYAPKWVFPLSDKSVLVPANSTNSGQIWFKIYIDEEILLGKAVGYFDPLATNDPTTNNVFSPVALRYDDGKVDTGPTSATAVPSTPFGNWVTSLGFIIDNSGDTPSNYRYECYWSGHTIGESLIGETLWIGFDYTLRDTSADGFYVSPNSGDQVTWLKAPGSTLQPTNYSPGVEIYKIDNVYSYSFDNVDPALMFKAVMDGYINEGGTVGYKCFEIKPTGYDADLTFDNQSMISVLNKILELCPSTYYIAYDIQDNSISLQDSAENVDHEFAIGKNVASLNYEVLTDEIINAVFFVGGTDQSNEKLYMKFLNQSSIDLYGYKPKLITDDRVSLTSTAKRIANYYLKNYSSPRVRANMTIISNKLPSVNGVEGYDLDTVKVGDVICIRGATDSLEIVPSTRFDSAVFDESYWDFIINQLGAVYFQIGRKTNNIETLEIEAFSLPPDINKKIIDNKTKVLDIQTLEAGSVPVEG
ncbi:hypothetical protein [Polynucleobacter sp.]|uniref:hypothetical protein n=1 Tax=Polynucleobacter sp. TaxID=2029855 RepID=UPI003F6A2776